MSLVTRFSAFPLLQQRQQLAQALIAQQLAPAQADIAHQQALDAVMACSDFVTEVITRRPALVAHILEHGWQQQAPVEGYHHWLRTWLADCSNEQQLATSLRDARACFMLASTWRDMTGQQPIAAALHDVSALADALIMAAYDWLYADHCRRYGTPQGEYGPQPMLILGMGKLGGRELNFSSDIDLIFTYPHKGHTDHPRKPLENAPFFTKLAQRLIAALNKVTVDGQVFRVDMRLRPFGDSGPLVMHCAALEDYYQEQGRHWERFAMVKARVLNPPSAYRTDVEAILHPFTYRRYLDFTTLDALRNMKQMISSEVRRRQLTDNIKLGAGGIREVEFFAQSFQLIHGGREPALQSQALNTTLFALADKHIIEHDTIEQLYQDYLTLRHCEHCLQQFADQQTQTLPESVWQQQALAALLQHDDYVAVRQTIDEVMQRIHGHFSALVETTPDSHDQDDTLYAHCRDLWQLPLQQSEALALLCPPLDTREAESLWQHLNDFRDSLRRFRLGQRGEDSLNKLLPELLYHVLEANLTEPTQVLQRLLQVIHAITGRTTYLDLLLENPAVLQQLVGLCQRSAWIAEQIARFPLLLDELLTPIYLQQQNTDLATTQAQYRDDLRQQLLRIEPGDTERLLDAWREFRLCQQLRVAASDLSGSLPINKVSDKLTLLAEVLLDSVFHAAWHDCVEKWGRPQHLAERDVGFMILAYGKLGGYELGYGSDLDLVFLHNAPREAMTDGKRAISAGQFYIKLAQRLVHLLTTKTLLGQLYEVDLRLRPAGNAGLLCMHIDGFAEYQQHEAWTWEHQALVRARPVFGDTALLCQFHRIRQHILAQPRDTEKLRQEVVAMREKMREHLLTPKALGIDLKQSVGGITDIEFLTQFWVLAYAEQHPALCAYTDNLRILDAVVQAQLAEASTVAGLQECYLALREHYHHLTLADHRYAQSSDRLSDLRQQVSDCWQQVLQSS